MPIHQPVVVLYNKGRNRIDILFGESEDPDEAVYKICMEAGSPIGIIKREYLAYFGLKRQSST
jgi:hypothetical protein